MTTRRLAEHRARAHAEYHRAAARIAGRTDHA